MPQDMKLYHAECKRVSELDLPTHVHILKFLERLIIRTLRLFFGCIIGAVSFYLFETAKNYFSIPFASLTPLEFFGGVLAGLGGIVAFLIALVSAFGPKGQSRIESNWRESQKNQRRLLGYDD